MCRRHSPLQQLIEAKQIALDHGCFVVERRTPKGPRYLLYRSNPHGNNVYIGQRATCEAIRALVCRATNFR